MHVTVVRQSHVGSCAPTACCCHGLDMEVVQRVVGQAATHAGLGVHRAKLSQEGCAHWRPALSADNPPSSSVDVNGAPGTEVRVEV